MIASSHSPIIKHLMEVGFIPKNCTKFTITAEVGKAVVITSEVFAEEDDIRKVCDALRHNPDEAMRITREALLRDPFNAGLSATSEYELSEPRA